MKNVWENPEIQSLNRLPMRSPLLPYADEKSALEETSKGPQQCTETESPFVKSLDGKWKFSLADNPQTDESEKLRLWYKDSFDDANWPEIQVPGTWTLQGFDKPHYTNVQMPFDCIPPNVPQINPTGLYRLKSDFPSSWQNRRIVLHIGSAESCVVVYVNGKEVGVSKDTRLPCEFEISPYIDWKNKTGSAVIALKVIRYSDGSFVEDQDQWWFGGIHRSMYVYSTEQTYIADAEALSSVKLIADDHLTGEGTIPLVVTLGFSDFKNEVTRRNNKDLDNLERVITYSVCRLSGSPDNLKPSKVVAEGKSNVCLNLRNNLNQLRTEITIKDAALWSNEHPNLYAITISLFEKENERHIESVCFTTGFKTTEIKDRELRFNGKMVYIHGVNRHEHNEYHGKTLTTQEMLRDIQLLKSYHFNAVRTCHYPDDERWYELCDRYGIYILDEANIENHAYYDVLTRSDSWTYSYMDRVQRMIRRDKNHACIFGWSLGNESGDGQNQVACGAWIRRIDKTRIVHYEGFVRAEWKQPWSTLEDLARGKGLTDLISPMYPSIDLIVQYAKTYDDYRPIIMCEYSHAMGNANGSLSDYWKAIESHHGLQGGFIWDWIDQGIASDAHISQEAQDVADKSMKAFSNPQGGRYWKYGGDFGDFPCDYDFCLNGLNFPDQTPKPAMEECRALFAPVRLFKGKKADSFEVENRYDFSTLSNLKMNWTVVANGLRIAGGSEALPEILPGKKASVKIPDAAKFVSEEKEGRELYLYIDFVYEQNLVWAKKGDLCNHIGIKLLDSKGSQKYPEKTGFDCISGHDIKNLLNSAKPELFRAILENEGVKPEIALIKDNPQLFSFEGKPSLQWLKKDLAGMRIENGTLFTGEKYEKKEKFANFTSSISQCKAPDGNEALRVEYEFTLTDSLAEYPRVGITIPIPATFNEARWYGMGPHECYNDRCYSSVPGLYELPCKDLEVPYIVPQENGERCGVKYLELLEENSKNGRCIHFQAEKCFAFTLSKYDIKNQFECNHISELTDLTKSANPHWNLTIDCAHRGVGTGACGPDTLEEYRVRPGVYHLTFIMW